MAQRQLISLVRRARSCSIRPLYSHHRSNIADHPCFCKVDKEFFSAAAKPTHRQTAGRVTDPSEKVAGSQKPSNGKSVPRAAPELSQNNSESNTSPGKLSRSLYLVVGACFAVVGVLTISPWVLPKNFYVEEKKEEDPHVLSEKADQEKSMEDAPVTSSEAEGGKSSLHESKNPSLAKREEAANEGSNMGIKEAQGKETRLAENIENLNASAALTKTESITIKSINPIDGNQEGEREHTILKAEQKEDVSQLIGHIPAEDFLPAHLSDSSKSNQSPSTVEKEDDASITLSLFTNKNSEGLAENTIKNEEANLSQVPFMGTMKRPSLLEAYFLANVDESSTYMNKDKPATLSKDYSNSQRQDSGEQPLGSKEGVFVDETHAESVHNVFDLLEVVHAAEHRQAELDARVYAEVQKRLKHSFQQELKDAQARELMYAEEANRLAKEIELERQRAVTVLELEQEKAKESLHRELKHKEEETQVKLKKAEIVSKTQIAAAIAEEKLSYLKDVKNVKQDLEALYAAFFTQCEEVRQSHTIHKLAVGTFALENAMKRGVDVQKEVALICSSYKDTGSDPLLDAVITSIPERVIKKGTMTPSQLQQKFEIIKGEILELSLLPATGGGLLSHTAAKLISILKVKEVGQYTDGVDGVVSQVQRLLTNERLADAADLLEKAVQGTEAEGLAAHWIECARDRAVLEQMLLLLQAHATAVASSLA